MTSLTDEHIQLFADYEARVRRNFRILGVDTGSEVQEFAGYISGLSFSFPIDDAIVASGSITVDGPVTRT